MLPVKFGKEVESLAAGESYEVFNNSKQDPGSWVVKIKKLLPDGKYVCKPPFHDTAPEPYAHRPVLWPRTGARDGVAGVGEGIDGAPRR